MCKKVASEELVIEVARSSFYCVYLSNSAMME